MSCKYIESKDLFEFDTAVELASDTIICKIEGRKAIALDATAILYLSNGLAWTASSNKKGEILSPSGLPAQVAMVAADAFNAVAGVATSAAAISELSDGHIALTNLFDKTAVTPNGYVDATGFHAYAAGGVSDYIPVTVGNIYTLTSALLNPATKIYTPFTTIGCYYTASKTYLSLIPTPTALFTTVTVPATAAYMRINYDNDLLDAIRFVAGYQINDTLGISKISRQRTRFYGKKIGFLGDSLTVGFGLAYPSVHRFSNLVATALGAVEDNQGSSGTLIAHQDSPLVAGAMVDRYTSLANDNDIVIVFGGINDYGVGVGVAGAIDSVNTSEFNGALNVLISGLKTKYTNKEIVFVTPYNLKYLTVSSDVANASSTMNLKGYRDCIIERCTYHGVPVIDLYANSGMDIAHNTPDNTTYTSDGVHLTIAGHQKVANKIIGYLSSI